MSSSASGSQTLMHLFLIYRYKATSIHYLTPTDDNHRQAESLERLGLFRSTSDEIGEIIVADVDSRRDQVAGRARQRRARTPHRQGLGRTRQVSRPSTAATARGAEGAPRRSSGRPTTAGDARRRPSAPINPPP